MDRLRLVFQHLFVYSFLACADSLAGKNGNCTTAMQPAERNMEVQLDEQRSSFNHMGLTTITGELLDIVAVLEALSRALSRDGGLR